MRSGAMSSAGVRRPGILRSPATQESCALPANGHFLRLSRRQAVSGSAALTIKRFDPAAYRGPLLDLPEGQLVRFIVHEAGTLYTFFNFVVEPAIGPPPRRGWDYLFCAEIPHRDLGLKPGQPGDIDILIIPKFNGVPRVEFAAAIEVKRLALRGPNWSKNVDR